MSTTHQQVLQSLKDWSLEGIVFCKQVGGKTSVEFNGEVKVYPHWLALQKVNQIGANYTTGGEVSD